MTLGRVAPLLALGVLSPVNAALYTPASGLRQVIVLSRHGVRGPYGLGTESPSEDLLKKYVLNPNLDLPLSAKAWGTSESEDPAEIVSPKLTKHGFHVVKQMGTYFRDHLYEEFLHAACEETFAYADDNQRDNLTAVAFLSGLYPLCKELVPITKETQSLFEQGQDPTASCPVCSRAVYEGITGSNDTQFVLQEVREEVAEVNELLQCCAEPVCNIDEEPGTSNLTEDSTTCDLFGIPTQWNGAFYLPWKDTLSNANYFSEWLLLQSLNNMSLPSQLSFKKILSLARIHETHMDLITNEVNSANFGATLLAHLTASFEQNVMQKPLPVAKGEGPHLLQGPDNRLLYYAAHDINLLYVRNLLRLQWHTKGWHPHQPVPGGMLVFELHATPLQNSEEQPLRTSQSRSLKDSGRVSWEADEAVGTDDASRFYVKLYFVAASPEQIRNGDELSPENPPNRVQVIIPSCSEEVDVGDGVTDVRCPFSAFKKLIGKTLKHVCVADTLRPFVDSLTTNSSTSTSTVTMDQTGDDEVSNVDTSSPSPKTAAALEASTMFGA
ncbi:Histidine phosphatase superfamily (branch 2) [Phytophthora infestans]|uniref:Histidine phosphatase superfamily (Branch 2) n=1 Tax=Phytophthora infestans TaxID=4787 RepID=A0A8S9U0G6_PHYIN|nr:Histidine phosphatase superfamily (branch 2) [Phytophthora infestans]